MEQNVAQLIQAVAVYRPRVQQGRTIDLDILSERLSRGSLSSRAIARMVLEELAEETQKALRAGDQVVIPGLGRFRMSLRMGGKIRPHALVDAGLRRELSNLESFKGVIVNRDNLHMSTAEIVELWNAEHPDDPVELPASASQAA